MKILVADNHEIVRMGLKQLLSDYTVIDAASADAAVNAFNRHKPALVILEPRLPGDGLKCLTRIKLEDPKARVLMLCCLDNSTYVARSLALGAQGYLVKSASSKEILAAVQKIIAGDDTWTRKSLKGVTGALTSTNGLDAHLTPRESEVLKQLALGLTNREIAQALGMGFETAKEHVENILRKIGVSDRTQAAVWAVRKELA